MSDVFISYKREDQRRVAPLAEALIASGLSVWWDRNIAGGVSWRESIGEELDSAKCVIVVWSDNSVSAAGDFVHDEAGRAKGRGVLLPVRIDAVAPPVGFGEIQTLDLMGWKGARGDVRFQDVAAAAKAMVEGGPRPVPKAPGKRFRLAALLTAVISLVAAVLSFLGNVAGLQNPICQVPGVHAICARQGWGGVATPAEQSAWERRTAGSCDDLRAFLSTFPRGVHAEEATHLLQGARTVVDERWHGVERRLPLTVRTGLTPLPTEDAARRDALTRSSQDVALVCGPYGQYDGFRLTSQRAEPSAWRCAAQPGGHVCGFDGQAVCLVQQRDQVSRQICR